MKHIKENDQNILDEANSYHYKDWVLIQGLIERAHLDETKMKLKQIELRLYHKEEDSIGLM